MKLTNNSSVLARSIVSLFAGCAMLAPNVKADDLTPPPWRDLSHPYSTLQAWEFVTSQNPTPPDGHGGGLPSAFGNGGPGPTPLAQMSPNMQWVPGPQSGWFPIDLAPGEIQLTIPNWIDFEPYKLLRVQITYLGSPLAIPTILEIFGEDNVVGPVVGSPDGPPVIMSLDPFDTEWHMYQDWTIWPNPDWEIIRIQIPPDTLVHQIVVDTISIPEPGSVVLGSLALTGLGLISWRSRRRRPRRATA